jgi:hypothetical protein
MIKNLLIFPCAALALCAPAAFAAEPGSTVELNIVRTGTGAGNVTGQGIDCGFNCTEEYLVGTQVVLTATPDPGSVFGAWTGACAGTTPECTVTLSDASEVTARFDSTAPIQLRDALYSYHLPLYALKHKELIGYNCDVFQILLDVESGFTDLALVEDNSRANYSDRIHDGAAMFSYALYSGAADKSFVLLSHDTSAYLDSQIGAATFFGYCFSTKDDAEVILVDHANNTCTWSDGDVRGNCLSSTAKSLAGTLSGGGITRLPGLIPPRPQRP